MATYSELIAQREALAQQQAALEKQIADQLKEQRSTAIAQVKALMSEYGLTMADVVGGKAGRPSKVADGAEKAKVAAKYRDPVTGTTWSGRGLKPRWLAQAIAEGKSLTDFAI
jgi:DNA-binding protein H-NS